VGPSDLPIHDWTRVDAGIFHHFHQGWIVALANALNAGKLPRVTSHSPSGDSPCERPADWSTGTEPDGWWP
jgi:hypothetical protein